jgi:hypothetical protein
MWDNALELAILRTLAYADVFDYPLRPAEVHRYLVGVPASREDVNQAMRAGSLLRNHATQVYGYYTLRGREELVYRRWLRERVSMELWPRAAHYGRLMAGLPFVRMVAVTGALAMNNVAGRVDLDYLIVTEPGRLWLCRSLVILLVRWAGLRGMVICPNYFISENALSISTRNLYTAHELTQMVPLSGLQVYRRMREANRWAQEYLPNALGPPNPFQAIQVDEVGETVPLTKMAETILRTPLGSRLECWEMERKIRKFSRHWQDRAEVDFGADWCKGHFDGHGKRAMSAYHARLVELGFESKYRLEPVTESIPAGITT